MAVPSMLMVAPRGRTKERTGAGTPSLRAASMEKGRVPAELAEEKANTRAGRAVRKKVRGLTRAMPPTAME